MGVENVITRKLGVPCFCLISTVAARGPLPDCQLTDATDNITQLWGRTMPESPIFVQYNEKMNHMPCSSRFGRLRPSGGESPCDDQRRTNPEVVPLPEKYSTNHTFT